MTLEHEVIGWSDTSLELDDSFAYAGKFRVPSGKVVTRDNDGETVAALSFSPDRADEEGVRVRYFAVRKERQGEGIGSALLGYAADCLLDRYETVRVSVNNPYSYEAAVKAGFGWTGDTSGLAELVMRRPAPDTGGYADGMRLLAERDLSEEEAEFVRSKLRG